MKKKLLFTATAALAVSCVAGALVAFSNVSHVEALTRTYEKSKTTVDITSISGDIEVPAGWEGYGLYTFLGSGVSSKGGTINLCPFDEDYFSGSYMWLDTEYSFNQQITLSSNYFMKLTAPTNNSAPTVYISVLIYEDATIIADDSYVSCTTYYNGVEANETIKLNENDYSVYEDKGIYYCAYNFCVELKNKKAGNTLTIDKIHIEYMC